MKPPIIICDSGDVLIFDSLKKAEVYLEPIDIVDRVLPAYDSEGKELIVGVTDQETARKGVYSPGSRVILTESKNGQFRKDELRSVLTDFLARIGLPSAYLNSLSLQELLEIGLKYKME